MGLHVLAIFQPIHSQSCGLGNGLCITSSLFEMFLKLSDGSYGLVPAPGDGPRLFSSSPYALGDPVTAISLIFDRIEGPVCINPLPQLPFPRQVFRLVYPSKPTEDVYGNHPLLRHISYVQLVQFSHRAPPGKHGPSAAPLRHPLLACRRQLFLSSAPHKDLSVARSTCLLVRSTLRTRPATSTHSRPRYLLSIGVPMNSIDRKAFPHTYRLGFQQTDAFFLQSYDAVNTGTLHGIRSRSRVESQSTSCRAHHPPSVHTPPSPFPGVAGFPVTNSVLEQLNLNAVAAVGFSSFGSWIGGVDPDQIKSSSSAMPSLWSRNKYQVRTMTKAVDGTRYT